MDGRKDTETLIDASKKVKIRIYKTIILPVVLYGL
jgi:hypothetical protein